MNDATVDDKRSINSSYNTVKSVAGPRSPIQFVIAYKTGRCMGRLANFYSFLANFFSNTWCNRYLWILVGCSLKVTGYSLFITFNCACTQTTLYGLWTGTISAVKFFFSTKNSDQYLWIRRDLVTNVLYDGQCRGRRSHFLNITGCCNFTEAKSHEVCTVCWTRGYCSKTKRRLQQMLCLALEYVEKKSIWSIIRRSRLLGRSNFGSKVYTVWLRMHNRSYKFSLWRMCLGSPFSCSIFCSCSQCCVITSQLVSLNRWPRPIMYPVPLTESDVLCHLVYGLVQFSIKAIHLLHRTEGKTSNCYLCWWKV